MHIHKHISFRHSPANKIHGKVIEFLKVVWCMRDFIRCVACVTHWDWWETVFMDFSIIKSRTCKSTQSTSPSHSTISLIAVKYFSSSFSGFVSSYLKKQIPLFAYRKRSFLVKGCGREDLPTSVIEKENRGILPLHSQNWSWWLWHVQCEGCHWAQEENEYESKGICKWRRLKWTCITTVEMLFHRNISPKVIYKWSFYLSSSFLQVLFQQLHCFRCDYIALSFIVLSW